MVQCMKNGRIFISGLYMVFSHMMKRAQPVIGKVFEKESFRTLDPACNLYEECRFIHVNFADMDLTGLTFRNCSFEGCDLSLARLRGTSLQEVRFLRCKMLGVQFSECRKLMLQIRFEECLLNMSAFNGLDLRNTTFEGCELQETDFTGADLSGSAFGHCDLLRATFFRTNLESADFRTACNYSIPPEENRLRKARFSMPEVTGLLDSYGIEIE